MDGHHWLSERLDEVEQRWLEYVNNAGSVLSLVRLLKESDPEFKPSLAEAARDGLRTANYQYAWSVLADLRKLIPEIFPQDLDRQIKNECLSWCNGALTDLDGVDSLDELADIRHAAEKMGVDIDDELYEQAQALVRETHPDSSDEEGEDHDSGLDFTSETQSMNPENELQAIRALFGRLTRDS
jgi:hypothetical protein